MELTKVIWVHPLVLKVDFDIKANGRKNKMNNKQSVEFIILPMV